MPLYSLDTLRLAHSLGVLSDVLRPVSGPVCHGWRNGCTCGCKALTAKPERAKRALSMVAQMDLEGFGGCSLFGECQDACPKEISIDTIARMNRDFMVATVSAREEKVLGGAG